MQIILKNLKTCISFGRFWKIFEYLSSEATHKDKLKRRNQNRLNLLTFYRYSRNLVTLSLDASSASKFVPPRFANARLAFLRFRSRRVLKGLSHIRREVLMDESRLER